MMAGNAIFPGIERSTVPILHDLKSFMKNLLISI